MPDALSLDISGAAGKCQLLTAFRGPMQTLNDMLNRKLLTIDQHAQIGAWISQARTPEAILAMPPALWRSLELASVLMNFDQDVSQAPLFSAD